MKTKICSTCKIEKPLEAFGKLASRKDGLNYMCKSCNCRASRLWKYRQKGLDIPYVRGPKPTAKKGYKFCAKCKIEKLVNKFGFDKKYSDNLNTHCKSCNRQASRKKNYGISEQEYQSLKESQDYKCGICGIDFSKLTREPSIDHDHKTQVIRGLLCSRCNSLLGFFKDQTDIIIKAAKYLKTTSVNAAQPKKLRKIITSTQKNLNMDYQRIAQIHFKYNLSVQKYKDLHESQNNKCAICNTNFKDLSSQNIHVDHNHATQAVRGLLCTFCNSALGHAKDNVDTLHQANAYLQASASLDNEEVQYRS